MEEFSELYGLVWEIGTSEDEQDRAREQLADWIPEAARRLIAFHEGIHTLLRQHDRMTGVTLEVTTDGLKSAGCHDDEVEERLGELLSRCDGQFLDLALDRLRCDLNHGSRLVFGADGLTVA